MTYIGEEFWINPGFTLMNASHGQEVGMLTSQASPLCRKKAWKCWSC